MFFGVVFKDSWHVLAKRDIFHTMSSSFMTMSAGFSFIIQARSQSIFGHHSEFIRHVSWNLKYLLNISARKNTKLWKKKILFIICQDRDNNINYFTLEETFNTSQSTRMSSKLESYLAIILINIFCVNSKFSPSVEKLMLIIKNYINYINK